MQDILAADLGLAQLVLQRLGLPVLLADSDLRDWLSGPIPAPEPSVFRRCFGLTPAEARVASRLICGDTIKCIARDCGTSVDTTRSQVRQVLSKVGVRRQAELMGVLARMCLLFQLLPGGVARTSPIWRMTDAAAGPNLSEPIRRS